MIDGYEVYEGLAEALNRLPNGFPRTSSDVEIKILRRMFSIDEASLAAQLGRKAETAKAVAIRMDLPEEGVAKRLETLARRRLVWAGTKNGKMVFRLAPFIVGSFEAQLDDMDHEFAHLVEEYLANGGAAGIMRPQPALHRVVPSRDAAKSEWILPYDDVHSMLTAARSFRLKDCICRVQQDHVGRRCGFPVRTCLTFSSGSRPPSPHDISKEEALSTLDRFEEIGLVHTVSNVIKGVWYVCNCCGCCCGILRGITDWGIENSVAHANYYATVDPRECAGCGICIERCQVGAISDADGFSVVNKERCIGCGLCVTGCPNEAVELQRKPDNEIVDPPIDFSTWEEERLKNRELSP